MQLKKREGAENSAPSAQAPAVRGKRKKDGKPFYPLRAGWLKTDGRLASAAAVSAEEAAISAAAAQQKDNPQTAVVAAAAVSAEPAAVSAAAGRQQKKPDQGIAAAVVAIVGAATSAVCSS